MVKDFVMIEWVDSKECSSDWQFIEDIKPQKPAKCISVGILFDDQDDYKTIIQTIDEEEEKEDSQIMARMTIPTCSITKITKLIQQERL